MRQFASIKKITNICSIDNADTIESVFIDGWSCVVKKNQFKIGDLVVYFEIDSLLPNNSYFDFLKGSLPFKTNIDGTEGFLLKTKKIRNTVSEGLVLPISMFSELNNIIIQEGLDVSELLNIKRYEPIVIDRNTNHYGRFPYFLVQSDQTNVQNIPNIIENGLNESFEITEKIEGMSVSYYYNTKSENKYGVCSHTLELKPIDTSVYSLIGEQLHLKKLMEEFGQNICFQGEIVGPKIEGNIYNLKIPKLFIYDIYDIDNHRFYLPNERMKIFEWFASKNSNILHVPILENDCKLFQKFNNIVDVIAYADGNSQFVPSILREGIVCKSNTSNLTFKIKSVQYKLKHKTR